MTPASATTTPQNNNRPKAKTIAFLVRYNCFCTILCLHPQNINLECPNSRFSGEREHTKVNFFILLPGLLERRSYQLTNELE